MIYTLDVWFRCVESISGSMRGLDVSVRRMESIYGIAVWIRCVDRCMDSMRGSVRSVDQMLENALKIHWWIECVDRCVNPRCGSDVWKALRKCMGTIIGLASTSSNLKRGGGCWSNKWHGAQVPTNLGARANANATTVVGKLEGSELRTGG